MKKICCIVLTVLVLLSNTSCLSFSKDNGNQQDSVSSIETVTTSKSIEHILWDQYPQISVFFPYPPANRNIVDHFDMRMEYVKEYVEKKYGMIVEFETANMFNYKDEMEIRFSSGDDTDIYLVDNLFELDRYNIDHYVNHQYAADLTDYIRQFYPEIQIMLEYDPDLEDKITRDGRVYAVPGCTNMDLNLYALVINKNFYDIEDKNRYLNVDEIAPIYEKLVDHSNNLYYGMANFHYIGNMVLNNYGMSAPVNVYGIILHENQPILFEETEYFKEAFEYGQKIFGSEKVEVRNFSWDLDWTDPSIFKNTTSIDLEEYKPAIAPVVELVSYYTFREKIYYNTKQFNEKYYVMPIKTNAPVGEITYQPRYFISSLSDEIEASLHFLYCLNYDKELYTMFRFGMEDTDYVNTPAGLELKNLYGYSQASYKFENPFIEPKLAHDFNLWGEFMEGYLAAQMTGKGMPERYRNEQNMQNIIKDLRESDVGFDEIIKERFHSFDTVYNLFKTDSDAIYEFMNGLKPDDGKYIIDQIMLNRSTAN